MKIKLMTPIERDGQKIEEITLDLEKLSGKDLVECELHARSLGDKSPDPLYSVLGLATIAGRAAGVKPDDILDLSAPDFLHVKAVVSNFMYGWVLPANLQGNIYDEQP